MRIKVESIFMVKTIYRLLVWLTLPVGCLLRENTALTQDVKQNNYIAHELTQFLHNAKEAFLNPVVTRTILDHLNIFLAKVFQQFFKAGLLVHKYVLFFHVANPLFR
jgi:hypothetical protein